jgi:molecular chaperone GrpE
MTETGHRSERQHRHRSADHDPRAGRHHDAGAAVAPEASAAGAAPVSLEEELVRVTTERDAYLEHLQSLQADFDNYRKRQQRESEQLRKTAAEDVVEALLPVIDNMYRACSAVQQHDEGQVVEGVEKVTGQLCTLLGSHGLQELPTVPGDLFDPTIHEAVMAQPSAEFEAGSVVTVLERGYRLHDKLLRPARVIVAS